MIVDWMWKLEAYYFIHLNRLYYITRNILHEPADVETVNVLLTFCSMKPFIFKFHRSELCILQWFKMLRPSLKPSRFIVGIQTNLMKNHICRNIKLI